MPGYSTFPESNLNSDFDMFFDRLNRLWTKTIDGMVYVFGSDEMGKAWQQRKQWKRRQQLRERRIDLLREVGSLLKRKSSFSDNQLQPHEIYVLRQIESEFSCFDYSTTRSYWVLIMSPLVFMVPASDDDRDKTASFGLLLDDVYGMSAEEIRDREWYGLLRDEVSHTKIFRSVAEAFEGMSSFEWFVPYADRAFSLEAQVDFLQTLLDRHEHQSYLLHRHGIQDKSEIKKLQSTSRDLFSDCPVDHHAFRRHALVGCSSCDAKVPQPERQLLCSCPFCNEELVCLESDEDDAMRLLPDMSEDDFGELDEILAVADITTTSGALDDH